MRSLFIFIFFQVEIFYFFLVLCQKMSIKDTVVEDNKNENEDEV